MRKKLVASDCKQEPHVSTEVVQPVPQATQATPIPPATQSMIQPPQPVIWLDFAMTQLRRELSQQLRKQQLVIESMATNLPTLHPDPDPDPAFITRDQRAHRRLSWTQRWARNAIVGAVTQWQVKLFGISSAILDWLHSLKPSPGLIM